MKDNQVKVLCTDGKIRTFTVTANKFQTHGYIVLKGKRQYGTLNEYGMFNLR